jgi:hypothetical protein
LSAVQTDGTRQQILDVRSTDWHSVSCDGLVACYAALVGFQRGDIFCSNTDGTGLRNISNTPDGVTPDGLPLAANFPDLSENGSVVVFGSSADLDTGRNPDLSFEIFVALLRPRLGVDGAAISTRPPGETFSFTGFGFTPNGPLTRRIRRPDGIEVTLEPPMTADIFGKVSWTFEATVETPPGTYNIWVIDDTTGRISNTVYEAIIR